MLKRISVIAITTLILFGCSYDIAHANEAPVNFGGLYAGADLNALSFENVSNGGTQTKLFTSDFGYSGHLGYGVQDETGFYYGLEGSDGTRNGVQRSNGVKDKFSNEAAVSLRVGQVIHDNLVYGKVGFANADVTEYAVDHGTGNFSGAAFGGGVERHVAENITARAEVVYTDYQVETINGNAVDPSNVVAKVGFSYLFH